MRPIHCYGLIYLIRTNTFYSRDMHVNMYLCKYILTMKNYRTLIVSIVMIMISALAFGQDTQDKAHIADDLNTALTLQGINCDGISKLEKSSKEGYEVICEDGGRYTISKTKNEYLSVIDNLTGLVFKGIGNLYGTIPFTGQIYQMPGKVTEHNAEVARSLFSIIELSGNVCEAITTIVKKSSDEHVVSCASGFKYHVYNKGDGLVAVDKISTNGAGAGISN
jgi:hypothetical protein